MAKSGIINSNLDGIHLLHKILLFSRLSHTFNLKHLCNIFKDQLQIRLFLLKTILTRSVTKYNSGSTLFSSHDDAVQRENVVSKTCNFSAQTYYFPFDKVKTQDDGYLIGALDGGGVYFQAKGFLKSGEKIQDWRQFFRSLSYFSPKNVFISP